MNEAKPETFGDVLWLWYLRETKPKSFGQDCRSSLWQPSRSVPTGWVQGVSEDAKIM